jgi:integrase
MSLFKRGNIWWVRFSTTNGQQIRKSAKTANKQLAQEYHDRLKTDYWRASKLGEKPRRKWEEAVERWLTEKQGEKVTLEDDIGHLRRVHSHLYGRYLDEIDRDILDSLAQSRLSDDVTNATVNRMLEVVRAILNRAERDWEWIERAPRVRMVPETKRRVRWLTREEAEVLLSELPEHLAAMAQFTLATGLRESNVVKLEWSQVNLDRRCAWIHADQAKARKAIPVPLNGEAVIVVRRQTGKHPDRVFTYKGRPVTRANNHAWRKALVRAGIENFRWHDLRHTWASWHVQQGTPLHVLQELGGWSDYEMVRRYAHLSVEHLAEYADRLSKIQLVSTKLTQSENEAEKKRIA